MKPCTICRHDRRHLIEIGLVHRVPHRVLAKRYGVSADALYRHGRNHLPAQARAAILAAQKPSAVDLEALQRSESEGLLGQLIGQRARLQQQLDIALEASNSHAAVAIERAVGANLELTAKLLGQLVQVHEVKRTSILISADYLQLRSTILRALQPFPEAMRAVASALHGMEAEAAKLIEHKDAS